MGETRRKLPWKRLLLTGLFSALAPMLIFVVVAHGGNPILLTLLAVPYAPAIALGFVIQKALEPFVPAGGSEFEGIGNAIGLFALGTAVGAWIETWFVLFVCTWIWKRLKKEKVEK